MTFDSKEKSRFDADIVECYRFKQASTSYNWTSADVKVVLPVGIFTPIPIARDELEFSDEDTSSTLEITVPRDNAVAALYIGNLSSASVLVQVFRAHRGELGLAIPWFDGFVRRCRFEESQAILVCHSLSSSMKRQFPTVRMQTVCNHILYSNPGCNATPEHDVVTVTTVTGDQVVSSDFSARVDQWFRGGRLVTPDGSERRFIADHVGDTITLISPLPGLQSSDVMHAFWGCDHTEGPNGCGVAKHNNLDLGFRQVARNPFDGRID